MKQSELEKLSIGNAAGTIKTLEEVAAVCRSAVTEITVGSITMEPRPGNLGETYYFHPKEKWSLNSLGLPNRGLNAYTLMLPEMTRRVHDAGKKLRVSVAGFSPKEYAILADRCFESGADEIELNLGCPNVWGSGGQKPIPSYHPELTAEILDETKKALGKQMVSVKISPVDNTTLLTELARSIDESGAVFKVLASNTQPNQERRREDGKMALRFLFGNGDDKLKFAGGLAGAPLLQQSLDVVASLANLLPHLELIGIGGIFTADDAMHYWTRGVSGFQCATALLESGPKVFSEILTGLSEKAA